ncbi:hypothetical protein HRbin39_01854 [bacterium HR39]|nr:hypothetical protein HRbin39_01854 [bacterium HR39]
MDAGSTTNGLARTGERLFAYLRRVLPRVPFAEDLLAAWYCVLDPQTPPRVRHVLLGAVAYFLLPADLLPDVLPALGFSDDAAVIALVLSTLSGHVGEEHRERARRRLRGLAED